MSTPTNTRRKLSLAVAALLACALIFVLLTQTGVISITNTPVKGLAGSEKLPLLKDERVVERFNKLGYAIETQKAGSREIATRYDLSQQDFSFPSGAAATTKIKEEHDNLGSHDVFHSPMVIATRQPIVEILIANEIAKDEGGWYSFDIAKYIDLLESGTRWSALEQNSAYDVNKQVLITSTDVRKSNSAAMYLSMLSYVANDNSVVRTQNQADTTVTRIEPAFLLQGFSESSSSAPFNNYLVRGMGAVPMVISYEAQFLSESFAANSAITSDMVMMYPQPTVLSQHSVVAHSDAGKAFAELLGTDQELKDMVATYGFRGANDQKLFELCELANVSVPRELNYIVDPPAYEFLENMITKIESAYE